jgi:hypothetical protein
MSDETQAKHKQRRARATEIVEKALASTPTETAAKPGPTMIRFKPMDLRRSRPEAKDLPVTKFRCDARPNIKLAKDGRPLNIL